MAALSTSRLVNLKVVSRIEGGNLRSQAKLSLTAAVILLLSLGIACFPLIPALEDFFVNGIFYEGVTLFSGSVDKHKHHNILQSYNGRYRRQEISWYNLRRMVREMFSVDYGGVVGRNVEFYGNDGVCIFKYLVTHQDPQKIFTISILILNFISFLFISFSYIIIHRMTTSLSRQSKSKMPAAQRRRQRKFETKICVIIVTDFLCWIPFITVCCLHYWEVIDASPWYPVFSILILPINSVINPLLYDDTVPNLLEWVFYCGNKDVLTAVFNHSIFAPQIHAEVGQAAGTTDVVELPVIRSVTSDIELQVVKTSKLETLAELQTELTEP